ncbi:RTA1-domain-containing protein [Aaosphaeria arxii CBS 175.79]|uniref:RTA1-domain-containing protein n=1 Tax=Aaosphaeria arxii CBS 175.79 TaxID=1450172 RepID=A0A6A5XEQ6_9PLEO|nr:RTA1-domain-containing protein [Aaosphaeria arxii CBS 175.79]KAF2011578.1 RTA1-domain-containing protein [Aaosphaeria arxii CBS 175.79]
MDALPYGLISFGPDANCTLEICPIEASLLGYRPSLAASGTFIGIFSTALIVHAIQGWWTWTLGFMASIVCGCILEIAGYVGRILIYNNPFDFNGFIMQIVCITIAPLFFCAAIYVLLSQVIVQVDETKSRFKPKLYYWIFIPCDVVSLVLQAVGGAMSCLASNKDDVQVGVDISLAGLVFQVVTITCFCALFADYLVSCKRSGIWTTIDRRMKFFLIFLFLSILFILVRCVYRIVELREGYFSEMFREQPLFIALESAITSVAVVCLTIGHPGYALHNKRRRTLDNEKMRTDSPSVLTQQ